jgi:predicted dehydrogenase
MNKIRIGIIGAGGIVKQRHLPGLNMLPQVEVKVVCNSRKETAEKFQAEFRIPEVAQNWQDVVGRHDLDAIWIGTPPLLHAPITIAALESGKHVFCQARMAMNLNEAREMLAASQKFPSQITMLCPPPHGMKNGKFFQKLLREGFIGNLVQFRFCSLNSAWADPNAPAHWRQKIEISGSNVLSVGIFAEVIGNWIGYPTKIQAQTKIVYPQRGDYQVQVPDIVQATGEWPNGAIGNLEWSGVAQFPPHEKIELYGTDGTLTYDFTNDQIFGARRGDSELKEIPVASEDQKSWRVEHDFIEAIESGSHPEPSFETGVKYMEFTEAIHRSALENRSIELSRL